MTDDAVPDFVARWFTLLTDDGRAALTRRRYTGAVRAFLEWFEQQSHEPFTPQRLTPIDLTGYTQHLQQTAAASTVNVQVCALRSFCGWRPSKVTLIGTRHCVSRP